MNSSSLHKDALGTFSHFRTVSRNRLLNCWVRVRRAACLPILFDSEVSGFMQERGRSSSSHCTAEDKILEAKGMCVATRRRGKRRSDLILQLMDFYGQVC